MKTITSILLCFTSLIALSQPETEVYLLKISSEPANFQINDFKNISNNPGYDSQPSFAFNYLMYAGTEDGQTEMKGFELNEGVTVRFNKPTPGGEYSPQLVPGGNRFSAVRLDTTGLQRLYYYSNAGDSEAVLADAAVAYYAFYTKDILLASILSDDALDLVLYDLHNNTADTLLVNAGRSIHKIPQREAMSYTVVNEEGNHDVFQLDMKTKESFFICQLPIGIQDYAWLDENRILIGSNDKLFLYDTFEVSEWKQVADLSEYNINNITRLAINEDGNALALVAEPKVTISEAIINKQLSSFNDRNLDEFVNCFSEDVVVANFPDNITLTGKSQLRESYQKFYENNDDAQVKLLNRMVQGNVVIDDELVSIAGKQQRQLTIFELKDGKIIRMTFLTDPIANATSEAIVDFQLEAYNNRDIDAFVATFADDIKLYRFPNVLTAQSVKGLRKNYTRFFENTPNLKCEIKNRMVLGSFVIDQESVRANENILEAIAVYKIENGRIAEVTFIQ